MQIATLLLILAALGFAQANPNLIDQLAKAGPTTKFAVHHTDAEWKKLLSNESYDVLRQEGTEAAYTGKYWDNHKKGKYACAGCDLVLFDSSTKFDSKTGWPSFYREIQKARTLVRDDHSVGMDRSEVICSRCGGHLGHVFDDGPQPTGLRYCMNSAALKFLPAK